MDSILGVNDAHRSQGLRAPKYLCCGSLLMVQKSHFLMDRQALTALYESTPENSLQSTQNETYCNGA